MMIDHAVPPWRMVHLGIDPREIDSSLIQLLIFKSSNVQLKLNQKRRRGSLLPSPEGCACNKVNLKDVPVEQGDDRPAGMRYKRVFHSLYITRKYSCSMRSERRDWQAEPNTCVCVFIVCIVRLLGDIQVTAAPTTI